ncbi:peptidoglycan DD-metalloendopeptidase family protein [Streptomyces sp. NPDC056527]|uniref:peptidoglycan DD-metalloendopeptidase family protein n=1 Tax=Streptomyces sp. NPDC056527 TaxID=3345853 RepID=UPI00369259A0
MSCSKPRAALVALLTGFALLLGVGALTTTARAAAPPAGKPNFQLPFACGTKWQLNTWGHNPALDIVTDGNTGSDGRAVYASAAGTVSATYRDDGSGNTIQINHGNGWFTAYYHLQEAPDTFVRVGDKVTGARQIGRVGKSGAAGGWAHLHYEQRYLASGTFTDERHRKPVHFDGVEYSGENRQWTGVGSKNCATPQQPWSCPSGHVCFYSGPDGTGTVCTTEVDTPSSACGLRRSYFNNGTEQPGYDHVYVGFKEGGTRCLHRGWAEGHGNFPAGGLTIASVRWGGECP